MNIEVEIKVEIKNPVEIRENVAKFGKLKKSIKQVDEYYSPCHRDFFAQKPFPKEWLRIRTNPDKVIFEYDLSINKDAQGKQEYAEEYETEVSSSEELRKILKFLDFKKNVVVEKQREYWDCNDIEVALDHIKGLGDFIEAEAKGNFASNKEAEDACLNFLEKVGVKGADERMINKGYPELVLENNK